MTAAFSVCSTGTSCRNLQLLYGADPGISYGKNEYGEGTGGVPFRGENLAALVLVVL